MNSTGNAAPTSAPGELEYFRQNVMVRVTRTPKEMPLDLTAEIKTLFEEKLVKLSGLVSGLMLYRANSPSAVNQTLELCQPAPDSVSVYVNETADQAAMKTLLAWAERYLRGFTPEQLLDDDVGVGIDLMFFEPNQDLTRVIHAWRLRGMWIGDFSTIAHGIERGEDDWLRTEPVQYALTLAGSFYVGPDVMEEAQRLLDHRDRGAPGGPGGEVPDPDGASSVNPGFKQRDYRAEAGDSTA